MMTVIGPEIAVVPTIAATFVLLIVYSATFVWLNRNRILSAIKIAAAWFAMATPTLLFASAEPNTLWIVALLILASVGGVGTLYTFLRSGISSFELRRKFEAVRRLAGRDAPVVRR
jgi:NADH:ubiquinone oxidoreductase subunit 6 (subunit J)